MRIRASICRETHTNAIFSHTAIIWEFDLHNAARFYGRASLLPAVNYVYCAGGCVCAAAAAAAARRRFIFIGFTAHCLHNVKCEHRAANFLSQPNRPHSALGLIKPQFRPSQRTLSERFMFAEAHSRRGQKRARSSIYDGFGLIN